MLTQGRFLISYQIFDNIPVNNIGQTHVREILKDTQAFTINYRTGTPRYNRNGSQKTPKILYSRQRPSGRDDNPIYLLLQCPQEMEIQSQGNKNPSST